MEHLSDRIVVVHGTDGVSRITLDKQDRMNALDPPAVDSLVVALDECDNEPSTQVVILTGAEGAFCAGGDITSFKVAGGTVRHRPRVRGGGFIDAFLAMEKPLIARVDGVAIGLGLTIALLADFVIASDNSRFGDRHVNLGVVAGDGVALILPLLVGPQRAKELLMTGRIIGAEEAARIGMILESVPRDKLDDVVNDLVHRLIEQPPYAARATKVAINRLIKTSSRDVIDVAMAYEEISLSLPDHGEAVKKWMSSKKG